MLKHTILLTSLLFSYAIGMEKQEQLSYASQTKNLLIDLWYHEFTPLQQDYNTLCRFDGSEIQVIYQTLSTIVQMVQEIQISPNNTDPVLKVVHLLAEPYKHYSEKFVYNPSSKFPQGYFEKKITIFKKLFDLYEKNKSEKS